MFDVIAVSTLSITDNNLLYLSLPPNELMSDDLEYNSIALNMRDDKSSFVDINPGL